MFDYVVENDVKNPTSLVVFLHGYNGTIEDHAYAINWLKQYLTKSILIVPEAPEICDKNPNKKQWFGMKKYDADNLRRDENTSAEQIYEIYNQTAAEISNRAAEMNDLISIMQKKYNISAQKTFLIGFSQGAMLALYTALSDSKVSGGVFALSGLIAGFSKLFEDIKSAPTVYLFHGQKDTKVQYKTFPLTLKMLQEKNINFQFVTYPELTHKISEEEVIKISNIINKTAGN